MTDAVHPVVHALPRAFRQILRGPAQSLAAASAALGLAHSTTACRAATGARGALLWLGPDERLLIAAEEQAPSINQTLAHALRELSHSRVEVSHRQRAFEVRGAHAASILNAGCPLDLDVNVFPVDACSRTVLAKAEIVLWRRSEAAFHVEVWRSFADYVGRFLEEISREYL